MDLEDSTLRSWVWGGVLDERSRMYLSRLQPSGGCLDLDDSHVARKDKVTIEGLQLLDY
jgi:hypothetical protein